MSISSVGPNSKTINPNPAGAASLPNDSQPVSAKQDLGPGKTRFEPGEEIPNPARSAAVNQREKMTQDLIQDITQAAKELKEVAQAMKEELTPVSDILEKNGYKIGDQLEKLHHSFSALKKTRDYLS